jgi:L-ribulose-5-phosphate 3-epimerase
MSGCSVGIMQGRLSPPAAGKIQSFPKSNWRDEFFKAKECKLDFIEWIFEAEEWEKNPLSGEEGVQEIKEIVAQTGVGVASVCADYFLDTPYLTATDSTKTDLREKLEFLAVQAKKIGAEFIDLPFVDASAIRERSQFMSVKGFIEPALKRAETLGVTIALETSLTPQEFRELLHLCMHPNLAANYDTGNSAALGYDCAEELRTYGKWIRTVHIKDRRLHGSTVPLGTGEADFVTFFHHLWQLGYQGPFTLQAAREGNEVQTAIKNKKFLERYLGDHSN